MHPMAPEPLVWLAPLKLASSKQLDHVAFQSPTPNLPPQLMRWLLLQFATCPADDFWFLSNEWSIHGISTTCSQSKYLAQDKINNHSESGNVQRFYVKQFNPPLVHQIGIGTPDMQFEEAPTPAPHIFPPSKLLATHNQACLCPPREGLLFSNWLPSKCEPEIFHRVNKIKSNSNPIIIK